MTTLKLSAALAAVFLLIAPSAFGADLTRDQYVAKVEPICKTNTEANEKILKGVRGSVKEGELDKAGGQFARAATALEKTLKQLKAVPQPTADEARLRVWLRYVSGQVGLLRKVATALKADNEFQAQSNVVRLTSNANQANATVVSFGFTNCKFNPSKFA
jgi:hypothetical protein